MSDNIDRTITPNPPVNFTPSMGNYKTLQPFRYWCQKVLPLVYDDSLSYYELLCKVVDYLNKTMEDVETLHGDVTNLHIAYVKLQGYVNDYFNNLDVQVEINNKLDEMAIDGTLLALISPKLAPIINEWLSKNITNPTNPPLDKTLTLENAAAEAKSTGSFFKNLNYMRMNLFGTNWDLFPQYNGYLKNYPIELEIGSLSSTGEEIANDNRIRSKFISCDEDIQLVTSNNLSVNVVTYNKENKFISSSGYIVNNSRTLSSRYNYRLVIFVEPNHLPDFSVLTKSVTLFYSPLKKINLASDFGFSTDIHARNDNAMSNYIANHSDEILIFDSGTYVFDDYIKINKTVHFLLLNATFKMSEYVGNKSELVRISANDCTIIGGSFICSNCASGIRVTGVHNYLINCNISDVSLYGLYTFGQNGSGRSNFFINCYVISNYNGGTVNDSYGLYDAGYDNLFFNCVFVNFKTGMLIGGGGKAIACHPWIGYLSLFDGSIAYLIDYNTIEFTNCVIDTYQRGIKTRGVDNEINATNLRVFINSDVTKNSECIIFQGTNVSGVYHYPILHVSNVSISKDYNSFKLIDFNYPNEYLKRISISGVTQGNNIINDEITTEKRLYALEH